MRKISNILQTLFFYFKPRKIVAQYKLYLGDEWLELSVDSIVNYVDKVLLVVSDVPWGNDIDIEKDNLEPIIKSLKNKYGNKIIVYNGSWNNQLEHVKSGLEYIKKKLLNATHCLYIDSDEIYTEYQIKKLLKLTKCIKYFNRAIRINYHSYFKSIYYIIKPEKWATALVLFPIRDYTEYLSERNNVTSKIIDIPEMFYEHFSYVRNSDEKIYKKLIAHKASIEPILKNWYEDVWLKWTPECKNFHPTNPVFFETVVKIDGNNLPKGVVEKYKEWATD